MSGERRGWIVEELLDAARVYAQEVEGHAQVGREQGQVRTFERDGEIFREIEQL